MRSVARYALIWILAGTALAVALVLLLGGRSDEVGLPPVRETDLGAAARNASCQLVAARAGQRLNPPVDGVPGARPASPAFYEEPPDTASLVGALRRGVVVIHFRPAIADELVDQLRALQESVPEGTIVTPNATRMPYELAATAYRRALTCGRFSPTAVEAVRLFVGRFLGLGAGPRGG